MTSGMPPEMLEAARLTQQGKLAEATAIIQRLLQGKHAANPGNRIAPTTVGAECAAVDAEPQGNQPKARFTVPRAFRPRTGLRETVNRLATMAKVLGLNDRPAHRPVPDPVPDGASFTAATYSNAAGTRSYKLYIPSTRTGERPPLIIMLHGCTQSADDFAAGTRMNALAEEQGFLAAYPEQHALANTKQCWNWFKADDQRRDHGEPSLIAGITRQIIRDHNVDPGRVYIAGLSAGGAAAAIMADTYPELYAAAGVHSGLPCGAASDLPSAFDAMRLGAAANNRNTWLVPTIVFHGDKDPIVHPRNGGAVAAQALGTVAGLRRTLEHGRAPGGHAYSRVIYADPEGRTICEHWSIHEAGHAWARGSPTGSHTDPHGPDASREMVRFFFGHRTSN
jgi:poly(hydroxyalkanoate) depolymerase family esterase